MENLGLSNKMNRVFHDLYRDKRVLITGHTGFKGSWLSTWLLNLGAHVAGYSLNIPTNPSNFTALHLENKLEHITGDVRDLRHLKKVFDVVQPEIVFHLAAQAITRRSYDMPQETFLTNLGGTVNILDCIRESDSTKAAVIITSDKCYQNVEWLWGYRENDRLGGDDPYSASKACAEMACRSYIKSFFTKKKSPQVATARAGNVIGGGDWAIDRIVPDCVRACFEGKRLGVRNPYATRPWQHALEPLSGYLWLAVNLLQSKNKAGGESFNFGPSNDVNRTVEKLINEFAKKWDGDKWHISISNNIEKKESTLLRLNCDKAMEYLNWHAVFSFKETVGMTADWYKAFYNGGRDMYEFTTQQIEEYTLLARERGLVWAG